MPIYKAGCMLSAGLHKRFPLTKREIGYDFRLNIAVAQIGKCAYNLIETVVDSRRPFTYS
jgi:hypothetical protein